MNEPPPAWAGRAEAGERGTSVSTWEEAGMSLWVTALRANPVKFTAAAASESFPPPGGCSRQFPLEMLPGIPYGDVPGNSLWGCSRKFPLGMLPKIPPGDAPDNSLWGCSRPFPLALYPRDRRGRGPSRLALGSRCPFPQGAAPGRSRRSGVAASLVLIKPCLPSRRESTAGIPCPGCFHLHTSGRSLSGLKEFA